MKGKNLKQETKSFVGGVISSKKERENSNENWLGRSFEERLAALEILRIQYLEMFNQPTTIDYSVFGKRKEKCFAKK